MIEIRYKAQPHQGWQWSSLSGWILTYFRTASLFKKLQSFLSSAIHQRCPSGCLYILWLTPLLWYDQTWHLHVFAAQLQIDRVQFFDFFLRKCLWSFCNPGSLSLMTRLDKQIDEERVQWYYHWNLPTF